MNRSTLADHLSGLRREIRIVRARQATAVEGVFSGKKLMRLVRKLVRSGTFESNDFVIAGSARLWIAGKRRRLSDLDIVARGSTWERAKDLVASGKGQWALGSISGDEVVRLYGGRIEVYDRWFMEGSDTDQLIDEAELHHGLRFFSIDQVIKYKSHLERPKDQADLAALSTSWAPSSKFPIKLRGPRSVADTTRVPA